MSKNLHPNAITRDYFDHILLEQRLVGAVVPDTSFSLYGETFSTPIMTAALSHLKMANPEIPEPLTAYAEGAKLANAVHWIGMTESEGFQHVIQTKARTIRIVKPYADTNKVFSQLHEAYQSGAFAVGMDIDHCFDSTGAPDLCANEQMAVYDPAAWKEFVQATPLPFIVKGVLSVRDAYRCAELGARGIVVSHHNGRMPFAVPPLMVLPDIRKELGKDFPIFVDCQISSGADAYKAMALGATAVSVGVHLMPLAINDGSLAVADRIKAMTLELRGIMAFTGVADTTSFDPSVIHVRSF